MLRQVGVSESEQCVELQVKAIMIASRRRYGNIRIPTA